MANEAMREAWDGEEGRDWAENADRYESGGARVTAAFLDRTPVASNEAVLDVGCGNGGLSIALATRVPDGSVLGVDLSSQMLEVAAKNAAAAGLPNVTFEQADAQTTSFASESIDIAVSSFGVMFFDDPIAAFSNIASALKPGGRISFIAWRDLREQVWIMGLRNALAMGRDLPFPPVEAPTPFSLSSRERTESLLTAAGFSDVAFVDVDEPLVVGSDLADAMAFVKDMGIVKGLSHDLDDVQKAEGLANIERFLSEHETPEGVALPTAALLISARKAS